MINLSLIKLRSFIAVGEAQSFRLASERMNLSQPAVSVHVRDLEETLGVNLISRTTRRVRLTPEGENFLIRARRALAELDAVVLDLKDQAALRRGRVIVGCAPTIAASLLPEVLVRFSKSYPDIRVEVVDQSADHLYAHLLNGEINLAICPVPPQKIDLEYKTLFVDRYVALCPPDHRLAGRKSLRLAEFVRYPLILLASPKTVQIVLQRAFATVGRALEPVYEVSSLHTVAGMVKAGLGITALPARVVPIVSGQELVGIPISHPRITHEIAVLYRRNEAFSPASAEFFKTIFDTMTGHP